MSQLRSVVSAVSLALGATAAASVGMLSACSRAEQAPVVSYTLLDGSRGTLSSLRGSVVLVNFWSTDCAPCVEEMPQFEAAWRKFAPQGFQTLAVSMSYDPPFAVANFAESRRLPFGVVIDNTGEIARQFGNVQFTPTSVLINRRGEIVQRWIGRVEAEDLQRRIEQALREG